MWRGGGRCDTPSFAFLCRNVIYLKGQEREPNINSVIANFTTTAFDGNKRIAAALTIMIAESQPAEKEMMINVIMNCMVK